MLAHVLCWEPSKHYREIYWLAVGADAVGSELKQLQSTLHQQLTGRGVQSEEVQDKEERKWLAMLMEAMAKKQQALLVLDDPWLPDQVRYLNPIDGAQTNHRLLVTTRIRDLVMSFPYAHLTAAPISNALHLRYRRPLEWSCR